MYFYVKDNTFRHAATKISPMELSGTKHRSGAVLMTRLFFYYQSNRSKYWFERCAFSLRTLQIVYMSFHQFLQEILFLDVWKSNLLRWRANLKHFGLKWAVWSLFLSIHLHEVCHAQGTLDLQHRKYSKTTLMYLWQYFPFQKSRK